MTRRTGSKSWPRNFVWACLPIKLSEKGPDHAKVFFAEVTLGGELLGRGTGSSKKLAERLAATGALETLAAREGDWARP